MQSRTLVAGMARKLGAIAGRCLGIRAEIADLRWSLAPRAAAVSARRLTPREGLSPALSCPSLNFELRFTGRDRFRARACGSKMSCMGE